MVEILRFVWLQRAEIIKINAVLKGHKSSVALSRVHLNFIDTNMSQFVTLFAINCGQQLSFTNKPCRRYRCFVYSLRASSRARGLGFFWGRGWP